MAYDIEPYRSLFPHLRTGKLWLNHAAISPLNSRTREAVDRYLSMRSDGTIDDYPEIFRIMESTKRKIAAAIGATPDRVAFTDSTSNGLNLLVNGIDWKQGDRIAVADIEFPANVVPFLNTRQYGVEIDFIRSHGGEVTLEAIEAALTPRTRLLSISFVQFLSGFKADLPAVAGICRRKGVIFSVDAIQGIGAAPIDVVRCGVDFLSCGIHKWLLGLNGTAFIYLTAEMQSRLRQRSAGWTSNKHFFTDFFRYRIDLDDTARRYENGSVNNVGIVALDASLSLLAEAGAMNVHAHLLDLTDRMIRYADDEGLTLLTPRDRSKRAGIVSFAVDDAERLFKELGDMNIMVSLRDGKIRVSPHFYNTADDIGTLCDAITHLRRNAV